MTTYSYKFRPTGLFKDTNASLFEDGLGGVPYRSVIHLLQFPYEWFEGLAGRVDAGRGVYIINNICMDYQTIVIVLDNQL